jgi:hypothetical protein
VSEQTWPTDEELAELGEADGVLTPQQATALIRQFEAREKAAAEQALRDAAAAWEQADHNGTIVRFATKHYDGGMNLPTLWLRARAAEVAGEEWQP